MAAITDPYALVVLGGGAALVLAGMQPFHPYLYPYRWWIIALVAAGLLGVIARAAWIPYRPEHRWLIAFMGVGVLTCLFSPMPEYSFARLATFAVVFVVAFLGAWLWFRHGDNVRLFARLLATIATIGAFLSAVYLAAELTSFIPTARITGAFGKATGSGSFAAAALPIVLWRMRYARGKTRMLFRIVLAILLYLLVFSGARAALIGGACTMLVWVWKHRPSLRPWLGPGVFGIVALFAIGFVSLDALPAYIVRKETIPTFTGRIPRWRLGLDLFWKSPLVGHGYGMTRYIRWYEEDERLRGTIVPRPFSLFGYLLGASSVRLGKATLHSDHVERLVEMGILGYIPFLAFWICIVRRIALHLWQPVGETSSLAMALGLNVGYIFLDSFMHGALFAINASGVLVMWVTIVAFMAASDRALVGGVGAPAARHP